MLKTPSQNAYNHSDAFIRCGQMPTKEGHDHCLRFFEKATSACCGHGVEMPYAILKQEESI
ncbi:MAG: hypothetical protein ACFFG0_04445 [Candidatus Thorarchaeota archaeon]